MGVGDDEGIWFQLSLLVELREALSAQQAGLDATVDEQPGSAEFVKVARGTHAGAAEGEKAHALLYEVGVGAQLEPRLKAEQYG